jgi:CRISPR system Cascade subunit CasB
MDTKDFKNELDIIFKWWKEVDAARPPKKRELYTSFNSGDSAELRRAASINDVIINCPAFHELRNRLKNSAWGDIKNINRLALVAGVLSHIRTSGISVAEGLANLANKKASKEATTLRFQRLIQNSSLQDLYKPMVRTLNYLEDTANVFNLAESLYFWGDLTRKQWAIKFYEKLI